MAATLRLMRERCMFKSPQLNSEVMAQIQLMRDQIFGELRAGRLGMIPLEDKELQEACGAYDIPSSATAIDPCYRIPLTPSELAESQEWIRSRFSEMSKHRSALLMVEPAIGTQDREELWKCFADQCVQELINHELSRRWRGEVLEIARQLSTAGKAPESFGSQAEDEVSRPLVDQSEFDLARASNERIFGLVLFLLPELFRDGPAGWSFYEAQCELLTRQPPFTRVAAHVSLAASERWWILYLAELEAQGHILAQDKWRGRCFLYDRLNCALYLYAPSVMQPQLLSAGAGQHRSGSVYFLSDYRFADVLSALNCGNELSRLWQSSARPASERLLSLDSERRRLLSEVFGGQEAVTLASHNVDGGVEFNIGESHARLRPSGTTTNRELSAATLPCIDWRYRLTPKNGDGSHSAAAMEIDRVIFRDGLSLICQPDSDERRLSAPNRLQITGRVRKLHSTRSASPVESDLVQATVVAAELIESNSTRRLRQLLDEVSASYSRTFPRQDRIRADLFATRYLERRAQPLSVIMQGQMDDMRIGFLMALHRRDEALELIRRQFKLTHATAASHDDGGAPWLALYGHLYEKLAAPTAAAATSISDSQKIFQYWSDAQSKAGDGVKVAAPPVALADRSQDSLLSGLLHRVPSNATQPRVNIALALDGLVESRFASYSKDRLYAKAQLRALWNNQPQLQYVDGPTATLLTEHWRKASDHLLKIEVDEFRRASGIVLLVWQTYHVAFAFHYPLPPELIRAKQSQLSELRTLLGSVSDSLESFPEIPQAIADSARAETKRSIARLEEYVQSPVHPYFYYPLSAEAFKDVVTVVSAGIQARMDAFRDECQLRRRNSIDAALRQLRRHGANKSIDFFQNDFHTWCALRASTRASLTMGDIVRYYGIENRDIDVSDRTFFPLGPVRALSLVYRQQEGLDAELHVEWHVGHEEAPAASQD